MVIILLVLIAFMLVAILSQSKKKTRTLERIDRRMNPARQVSTIAPDAHISQRVRDYIEDGDLVGAIKQYREESGVGLKEAKDHILSITKRAP